MPRIFAALLSVCLAAGAWAAQDSAPEPRITMHEIFTAISLLLPASLDEHAFVDPLRREELLAQLRVLERSVDQLERHAAARDEEFRFLSRSLARDVRETAWLFEQGRTESAGYQLTGLVQNCVACHSRLPSDRDDPLADKLLERAAIAELPPQERAHIQVAVRRFDAALADWETAFSDPDVSSWRFDMSGALLDYLTIAIRVQRDLPRAQRTLEKMAARPDAAAYLQHQLRSWIASLQKLRSVAQAPPDLEAARGLIREGSALSGLPPGRERLVHDLVASIHLHRLIDAARTDDPRLAEAFFLLGLIEGRTIDSYFVPQAEFHLEAAIRADPSGPFAEPAYIALEEYIVTGSGGVSEAHASLAFEELAELRALIERAQGHVVAPAGSRPD